MSLLLLFHPRVAVNVEAATVYLDLQPLSLEEYVASDDATVYLDIQPGSIFLQVDCVLEIVEMVARWSMGAPQARWTITSEAIARWRIVELFARWTLLETRRFHWKP